MTKFDGFDEVFPEWDCRTDNTNFAFIDSDRCDCDKCGVISNRTVHFGLINTRYVLCEKCVKELAELFNN